MHVQVCVYVMCHVIINVELNYSKVPFIHYQALLLENYVCQLHSLYALALIICSPVQSIDSSPVL